MITLVILLTIVAVVIIAGAVLFFTIKNKVEEFSTTVFGSEDIVKNLKDIEIEANNTPISLSGGDSIYLTRITKDFSDFHRDLMETKVKNFIADYIEGNSSSKMDTTDNIKDRLVNDYASNLRGVGYSNVVVHDAAIFGYEKSSEMATVHYQVAAEYIKSSRKVQTKYSVSLVYLFKDTEFGGKAIRCNYCNAPLENENATCAYCGAQVVRNIEKVWKINDYKKLI